MRLEAEVAARQNVSVSQTIRSIANIWIIQPDQLSQGKPYSSSDHKILSKGGEDTLELRLSEIILEVVVVVVVVVVDVIVVDVVML